MIYVIWGSLNILLLLFWIYIGSGLLFKSKPFATGKSRASALFFIVGLLVLMSAKSKDADPPKINFSKPITLTLVETGKTLTNHISIVLIRDKESGEILTQYTDSNLTGYMSGLDWKQLGVNEIDGKLEVSGLLSWKLFGLTLYTESKHYSEVISKVE